jgi:hypothetical protein
MVMIKKYLSILTILLFFGAFSSLGNDYSIPSGLPEICYSQSDFDGGDTLDLDQYIDKVYDMVKANNKLVGLLSADQAYTLPIGLHKDIGGLEYLIVLDNLRIDPQGGWISAYMQIKFPGSGEPIGLYADSVRITKNGIQTAQLRMIQDRDITIGGFTINLLQSETYIQWNCNGYESTTIGGELIFNNDMIKPVPDGTGNTTNEVFKGTFQASFEDLSNIMAEINLPDFTIKGVPDMVFYPGTTAMDFSDFDNPDQLVFPEGYYGAGHPVELYDLWRGVYIHDFTVQLPQQFSGEGSGGAMSISAQRLMIDDNGITGGLFADSVLSLEQGNLGGWNFSLDRIGFTLMKNNFQEFEFDGRIVVPISEDKPFHYSGVVDDDGDIMFTVETLDSLQADLWAAKLALEPNSLITVQKEGNDYFAQAVLHGSLEIGLSDNVELGTFTFQGLRIATRQPYLSVDAFGLPNGLMSGFPVNVTNVNFETEGNMAGLSMEANVNFMGDGEGGFAGTGGFSIWAEKVNNKWRYDHFEVHKVSIAVDQGSYAFFGEANFYNGHEVFGRGFKGMVAATFAPGIAVEAALQLGKVNGYRYFYADALMVVPNGISIMPGMGIYGFGGGISYRMQRSEPQGFADVSVAYNAQDGSSEPGPSLSGVEYIPNSDFGLGLKAKVVLGTHPNPKAMNGSVELGLQFYSNGGLESIRFHGEGVVMAELNTPPSVAMVGVDVDIMYNFTTRELFGASSVYVNIKNKVKGIHANNRAGTITTYFGPTDWFIYAGKPDDRIGLDFIGLMEASAYMMVGTDLPPFPPLPDEMSSLANEGTQQRIQGMLGTGNGFAIGSMFEASTGEVTVLIFYGSVNFGAGFDIMIRDLGPQAFCSGFDPPLGIEGWYAMGQVYAYLDASIGIKVKIFRKTRKFKILQVGAAAVLQGALPNPTFLSGGIEGRYSVLNGLVKGRCVFDFEVGQKCEIEGAELSINIISKISPDNDKENVDVFVTPRVAFNYAINQSFELQDIDGQIKQFRITLEEFTINTGDAPYNGTQVWNNDKNVLSFNTKDLLPGEEAVTVKVKVAMQYLVNNEWIPYENNDEPATEEMEVTFTTGQRPDHIPEQCIVYNYPMANMHNFYWQEYNQGFVQMTHNFYYLFEDDEQWESKAYFKGASKTYTTYSYDDAMMRLTYDIPANLTPEMVHTFNMVKLPKDITETTIDEGITTNENTSGNDTITTMDIEGDMIVSNENMVYSVKFRTSYYATFTEKINSWSFYDSFAYPIATGMDVLIAQGTINECLSKREVGDYYGNNLIQFSVSLDQNLWFMDNIYPDVYEDYPINSWMSITHRNPSILGVPPNQIDASTVNVTDIEMQPAGHVVSSGEVNANLNYSGIPIMHYDLDDLQDKAVYQLSKNIASATRARLNELLNYYMPTTLLGQSFVVTFEYTIPGLDIVTSTPTINVEI